MSRQSLCSSLWVVHCWYYSNDEYIACVCAGKCELYRHLYDVHGRTSGEDSFIIQESFYVLYCKVYVGD